MVNMKGSAMKPIQGTITALVTPFRDGKVDLAALEALVERQLAAGVDGLVPCGTTGEIPTLTLAEHRPIVSLVAKLAKRKVPVIAGSGANSTAEALELVRLNMDCGADALLIVAPYFNQPSQEGLRRHYATLAAATPLPIVLYNIPSRTGVDISIATVKRLFDEHANIVAIKHATESVIGAADLMAACDIPVLSGDDPLTLPLMSIGAVGVVSTVANVFPRAVKRLTEAALAGDWAAAQAAHRVLYPLAKALLALDTNPIPVKTALALKGLCKDEFRMPLCEIAPENRRRLAELLDQYELD
jgi:4-hydroxy-tetrahydrodipicolinate synthase